MQELNINPIAFQHTVAWLARQTAVIPNTHALLVLGSSPLKREVRMRHILSFQEWKELVTRSIRCSITWGKCTSNNYYCVDAF